MRRSGPAARARRDATDGCRKPRPAPVPCFGVVLYNEYRNFNVSPSNGDSNPRRDRDLGRRQLRRKQHLTAGGRQVGHLRPRAGLRRRRRPGVEHGVGEPIRELLAAAVVRRPRRLRFAFRVVGRADEPNVEVKVVSPPRLHLAEPTAVRAIDTAAPTRLILIVRSSDATGLLQEPKSPEPQSKNSTAPVSKLYMAPAILTAPFASSSARTELSCRIPATVISTFFRATASTKA